MVDLMAPPPFIPEANGRRGGRGLYGSAPGCFSPRRVAFERASAPLLHIQKKSENDKYFHMASRWNMI